MPSFNCDGCGDVVKKPKLDSHSMRCRSSVTCLDCSTTFTSPAGWKTHTSCISEAEKYQKSLYKPPKNNKSNGDHQASLKNNSPTSGPVTPIDTPTPTNAKPTPSNLGEIKATEPTRKSDDFTTIQTANQVDPKENPKKKNKKRNRQNQKDEVVPQDQVESTKSENPKDQSMKKEGKKGAKTTTEDAKQSKKSKAKGEEAEQAEEEQTTPNKKKRKKEDPRGGEKGEEEVQNKKEVEKLEDPTETKSKRKKSQQEKKKLKQQKSRTQMKAQEKGNVDDSQELGTIDERAILKHCKEMILAANGQPIKLNDLITSNVKSIIENNKKLATSEQDIVKDNKSDDTTSTTEELIRNKIQQIFHDNLQFVIQKNDQDRSNITLSWNSGPF